MCSAQQSFPVSKIFQMHFYICYLTWSQTIEEKSIFLNSIASNYNDIVGYFHFKDSQYWILIYMQIKGNASNRMSILSLNQQTISVAPVQIADWSVSLSYRADKSLEKQWLGIALETLIFVCQYFPHFPHVWVRALGVILQEIWVQIIITKFRGSISQLSSHLLKLTICSQCH